MIHSKGKFLLRLGLVALVASMSLATVAADPGVDPPGVEATLKPGESLTVTKTVYIGVLPPSLDTWDIFGYPEGCAPLEITFEPPVHENVLGQTSVVFEETIAVPATVTKDALPEDGLIDCTVWFWAERRFDKIGYEQLVGEQSLSIEVATPVPIGGYIVPVSKFELLSPWMGLAALMAVVVAAVVVRRRGA